MHSSAWKPGNWPSNLRVHSWNANRKSLTDVYEMNFNMHKIHTVNKILLYQKFSQTCTSLFFSSSLVIVKLSLHSSSFPADCAERCWSLSHHRATHSHSFRHSLKLPFNQKNMLFDWERKPECLENLMHVLGELNT